jgi:hypothetical protein
MSKNMISTKKIIWILVNLLGGTAVIGSYVYGFLSRANAAQVLWGGVPVGLRPLYTTCMFVAAAGFFALAYFVFRLDTRETRVAGRFGFGIFTILYLLVLVPSACWMPLTLTAIEQSSAVLILMVRLVLALVAVGSLGLMLAVLKTRPRTSTLRYILAVAGSAALCLQTVILDAILWSIYFHG